MFINCDTNNLTGILLCTLLFLCVCILVHYLEKEIFKNLPPGPWGLPVVGHLPFLGDNPQKTFNLWRKQYGDVFRIRLGSWPSIVINRNDAINEAVLNSDDFSSRPGFFTMQRVNGMKDLTFGEYNPRWLLHRRIVDKIFRQLVHKRQSSIEQMVVQEAKDSINTFLLQDGHPFDPVDEMGLASASVVYQICYGQARHIREDEHFLRAVSASKDFIEFSGAANPVNIIPWLRYLMPWEIIKVDKHLQAFISGREVNVKDHADTFDKDNIRDITDALLFEESSLTKNEMEAVGLTSQQLFVTLDNIMGAGIETVASTLTWAIKLMAAFPEIQLKVQKEIDKVVGNGRSVRESDRMHLPFTEGTVLEILRFSMIAPFGIPHFTTVDTKLQNYHIPKGTVAFVNLHSLSFDKHIWGDPEVFRPGRFLTCTGQVDKEMRKNLFPFGLGRRRCPGEQLARLEIFLYLSTFLQCCTFQQPEGMEYDTESVYGLTCRPTKFKVIVRPR